MLEVSLLSWTCWTSFWRIATWSLLKGESEVEVEVEAADEVDTKFPTEFGSLVSRVDFELGGFPCSFQQVSRRCPGHLQWSQ